MLLGGVGLGGARGGDAKVRVAHAVPDAPPVEVTLTNTDDGSVSETVEVAFEGVTGYLEVPAGEYEVAVPAADFTATVELEAEDYTAAAIGNLAPEGDEDGFKPVLAYEDAAPPDDAGGGDRESEEDGEGDGREGDGRGDDEREDDERGEGRED